MLLVIVFFLVEIGQTHRLPFQSERNSKITKKKSLIKWNLAIHNHESTEFHTRVTYSLRRLCFDYSSDIQFPSPRSISSDKTIDSIIIWWLIKSKPLYEPANLVFSLLAVFWKPTNTNRKVCMTKLSNAYSEIVVCSIDEIEMNVERLKLICTITVIWAAAGARAVSLCAGKVTHLRSLMSTVCVLFCGGKNQTLMM